MERLSKTPTLLARECKHLEQTIGEIEDELKIFQAHLRLAQNRLKGLQRKKPSTKES